MKNAKTPKTKSKSKYVVIDLLDATGPEIQRAAGYLGLDEEGSKISRMVEADWLSLSDVQKLIRAIQDAGYYSIKIDPYDRIVEDENWNLRPFEIALPVEEQTFHQYHQRDYLPTIGDMYQGKQVTEVKIVKGHAWIFGIDGRLSSLEIKALRKHFAKPENTRGFMFRPGNCFARMRLA